MVVASANISAQILTPFEKSKGKSSATLSECLGFYRELQSAHKEWMKISEPLLSGTDLKFHNAGQIKLVCITNFSKKNEKVKILINNAIHPGEPDGVDASMMLARDFILKPGLRKLLDDIEIYIIPVYNTGGALRRGCCSRANQDGPVDYGFRGNALNLDLNRDFIKCDAMETEVFENYFHKIKPQLFIDTHVSDGADYQYTMTLIASQTSRLQNQAMEGFQKNILLPSLFRNMKNAGQEMSPYIDFENEVPDSGIIAFFDSPRYSSGYASLFNCFSFISETHMLKPFDQRVEATYTLLLELIRLAVEKKEALMNTIKEAEKITANQKKIGLHWAFDTLHYDWLVYKGYEAYYQKSELTGLPQLYYNEAKPFTKTIPYYNGYAITKSIDYPIAYVMPYEWYSKLNLQRYNLNIKIIHDTTIRLTAYTNVQYTLHKNPYEGNIAAIMDSMQRTRLEQTLNGYWVIIPLGQNLRYQRFLVEALEPESPDGFFAWGKMYSFVQQKEGFSDYVWDKKAYQIYLQDSVVRNDFNKLRASDDKFVKNKNAQLDYIYHHSTYYENSHLRYPIFRIEN